MAIYYLDVKPIGGNSCLSAVGAAAYRSGEKLHNEQDGITHDYTKRRGAVGAAAYRSGGNLNDGNVEYDFTHKGGIVYSEIILPKHAPETFQDRSTLWNASQKAEKNYNARTGREIVVALPNELTTEQKIKVVRDYVRRNFVDEGMCADFSFHAGHIHEQKGGVYPFQDLTVRKDNPHAHIQLTVRLLNKDGTWGAKSKKEYILDKNGNRIKLKSGEWKSRKIELTDWDKTETLLKWREDWAVTVNREFERLGIDERISHLSLAEQGINREPTKHMGYEAWNLEKKGIKTEIGNENRDIMARNRDSDRPENIAEHMHELKQRYIAIDKSVSETKQKINGIEREMNTVQAKTEEIEERAGQIQLSKKRIRELEIQRQKTGLFGNKKAIDEQIQSHSRSYQQADNHFKRTYGITPEESTTEIKRLEIEIKEMEQAKDRLQALLPPLLVDKEVFKLEYHRLFMSVRHDRQQILDRLEQLDKETCKHRLSPKDEIARMQSEADFNILTDQEFEKIMQDIPPEQREIIIHQHDREKERERVKYRGR